MGCELFVGGGVRGVGVEEGFVAPVAGDGEVAGGVVVLPGPGAIGVVGLLPDEGAVFALVALFAGLLAVVEVDGPHGAARGVEEALLPFEDDAAVGEGGGGPAGFEVGGGVAVGVVLDILRTRPFRR